MTTKSRLRIPWAWCDTMKRLLIRLEREGIENQEMKDARALLDEAEEADVAEATAGNALRRVLEILDDAESRRQTKEWPEHGRCELAVRHVVEEALKGGAA